MQKKGLFVLAGCLFVLLALVSFTDGMPETNWLGLVGHGVALGLLYLFGLGTYLAVAFGCWIGWRWTCGAKVPQIKSRMIYFGLFTLSLCMILNLGAETAGVKNPVIQSHVFGEEFVMRSPFVMHYVRYNLGGVPLYYLFRDLPVVNLQRILSNAGIALTFSIVGLVSLLLMTEADVKKLWGKIKRIFVGATRLLKNFFASLKKHPFQEEVKENPLETLQNSLTHQPRVQPETYMIEQEAPIEEVAEEEPEPEKPKRQRQLPLKETVVYQKKPRNKYRNPALSLLSSAKKADKPSLKRELRRQAEVLEETLASFGIEAKVGQVNCGPTITSFDVHPAIGVKVQKIKALEDDIALNMQAKSIRIIAPIPGKAAVGVEVPSLYPQEVGLKEMLARYQQNSRKFHIPVLLGKTVTGDDVMCDLTKMPHCIIAGATGSGKSVCINSIVISILMNASPEEVRLLLIDPKKVELSGYSRLPHMIAPVITEAHGAYAALSWLVKEMQERYEIFKNLGVRNIAAFNTRTIDKEIEEALEMEIPEKMPYFVAIVDEFADLMMASSSDLETPIARIAQMARAVGIHLILATQRPSREVITGLIKANFPTRISFKVSSRINSQIILDENGAETLLGNGDLLFMPPGSHQLIRAQGVYISDEDINKIVSDCCRQQGPEYLIKSFDKMTREEITGDEEPKDDLYSQAYEIVVDTKTASTTFLQRKLKIGYARAASLMDELENRGVISPQEGSRPRKVLK